MSFSEELLSLYKKVNNASSYKEKHDALIDLATQYARDHDSTDQEINEEFHQLVEDFEMIHHQMTHVALRLGRMVTAALDVEDSVDTDGLPSHSGTSTKDGALPN